METVFGKIVRSFTFMEHTMIKFKVQKQMKFFEIYGMKKNERSAKSQK